ncbi:MAG: hypothetical protein ACYC77_02005 [Coriobacteriia bacterium]
MPIGTDGDGTNDNEGPHCRNCHVGANNCDTCHSDDSTSFSAAYTADITQPVKDKTNYSPQSYIRQSAVSTTTVGEPCLDGGFSFPHRTLGANMLKDELFGIDFDGSLAPFGDVRTFNGGALAAQDTTFSAGADAFWIGEKRNATSIIAAVRTDSGALEGAAVENLDSVCIDCHGDATYWNGDDTTFLKTEGDAGLPLGTYGAGQYGGWDLLLKGLP